MLESRDVNRPPPGSPASRPVILCPMGGLANRLRAIDSALTLCRRFARPLRVVWIRDARQIDARFSDLFEPVDGPDVSIREATALDRLRYAPPSWRRNLRFPALWQTLRFGPSRRLSVPRGLVLQRTEEIPTLFAQSDRTVFLHAWWQMVPSEERYAAFRPLPPLLAEIDALAAAFPGSRTVGVHVRRGDHAQAIRRSPVEAFEARMDTLLASGETDSFFLATDDPVVRDRLAHRYGDRLLVRDGSSDRSTPAGMRGAVVDLWTLSHCARLLASFGSTFAPTAATLGDIPCETVETLAP